MDAQPAERTVKLGPTHGLALASDAHLRGAARPQQKVHDNGAFFTLAWCHLRPATSGLAFITSRERRRNRLFCGAAFFTITIDKLPLCTSIYTTGQLDAQYTRAQKSTTCDIAAGTPPWPLRDIPRLCLQ